MTHKIQHQSYHIGIENVELFEKTRLNILRQSNSMWLEDNTNYNIGFNHAWVALQGAASENVVEGIALKKANQRIQQLEAELATLQEEQKVETLLPESTVAEVVGKYEEEQVAKAQAEVQAEAAVTPKPKRTRTSKAKGTTSDAKTSE